MLREMASAGASRNDRPESTTHTMPNPSRGPKLVHHPGREREHGHQPERGRGQLHPSTAPWPPNPDPRRRAARRSRRRRRRRRGRTRGSAPHAGGAAGPGAPGSRARGRRPDAARRDPARPRPRSARACGARPTPASPDRRRCGSRDGPDGPVPRRPCGSRRPRPGVRFPAPRRGSRLSMLRGSSAIRTARRPTTGRPAGETDRPATADGLADGLIGPRPAATAAGATMSGP